MMLTPTSQTQTFFEAYTITMTYLINMQTFLTRFQQFLFIALVVTLLVVRKLSQIRFFFF